MFYAFTSTSSGMAHRSHRIACVLLLGCMVSTVATVDPFATVAQGELRGRRLQTYSGKNIFAFLGIPYAKAPIGDLRFRPPESPESWKGFRDAKIKGYPCPQRDYIFEENPPLIGNEDCLFLNVYTTQLQKDVKSHPVLVWIHGGGWQSGEGAIYGPEYLLDHDVVLVTINYRLGPLGFLSTEDENSPGNYGLKDQIAALRWVRDNIAAFRGDPNRVIIAGQSAGGASVHYLTLAPPARGLFHAAISMSGTSFAYWASARQPGLQARRLASLLGCPEEPSSKLVACLRTKDATEFVDAPLKMLEWNIDPLLIFSPSVEPLHTGERVVPEPPVMMMSASESILPVPWMAGMTSEDGSIRTAVLSSNNATLLKEMNEDFERIAPISLRMKETAQNASDVAKKIRNFYFGDRLIDTTAITQLTEMYSDRQFLIPLNHILDTLHKLDSKRLVFLYRFSHRGKHSITERLDPGSDTDYGVCHLDDLQYVFHMPQYFPPLPVDPNHPDHQMMKILTQLFANFIRTGHPTPKQHNNNEKIDEETFQWQSVTPEAEFADLRLPMPTMLPGVLHGKRRAFWKSLLLDEHLFKFDSHDEL